MFCRAAFSTLWLRQELSPDERMGSLRMITGLSAVADALTGCDDRHRDAIDVWQYNVEWGRYWTSAEGTVLARHGQTALLMQCR